MGGGRIPGSTGVGAGGAHASMSPMRPPPSVGGRTTIAPAYSGRATDESCRGSRASDTAIATPASAPAPRSFVPSGRVQLPVPLTPESLANLYMSLPVQYLDPATGEVRTATCSPAIYANTLIAGREPNAAAAQILIDAANRAARVSGSRLSPPSGFASVVRRSFRGHGLPADLSLTLSLALSTGLRTPGNINEYCHNRAVAGLGLDCVGFIQAYFQLRHGITTASAINNYRVRSLARTTLAAIQPDDVLVWESSDGRAAVAHIAVVSSRVSANRLRVGESTGSFGGPSHSFGRGGGVSISTYELTPAEAGNFSVRRNLEGSSSTSTVSVWGVDTSGGRED